MDTSFYSRIAFCIKWNKTFVVSVMVFICITSKYLKYILRHVGYSNPFIKEWIKYHSDVTMSEKSMEDRSQVITKLVMNCE